MRPSRRALGLALAAFAVFGAVVAVQLARGRSSPAVSAAGGTAPSGSEAPVPVGLAPAGASAGPGGGRAAGGRGDPARPARPTLSVRLDYGALAADALSRATFVLRLLAADGAERTLVSALTPGAGVVGVSTSPADVEARVSSQGARTDVLLDGLPPGTARVLAVVRNGAGVVLGIAGPGSVGDDRAELVLDVAPLDRLGRVAPQVRREGTAFGPAGLAVRAGGLTVESLPVVRGRAEPVAVPTGTPVEVVLLDAPGRDELGLPPAQEVILAPRETKEVTFDLDDGVAFSIRALDPSGAAAAFRARVWMNRDGRGPRPAPGLLLTSGSAFEHAGRGPVGELWVLVIPTREGAPTWAKAALVGRATVPIDVRLGHEGGVLDLRLSDPAGAPRAGWQVDVVRTDAAELSAFAMWAGSADARGHLVTPRLPAGAYLLTVGGCYVRSVAIPAEGLALASVVPDLPAREGVGPVLDVTASDAEGRPSILSTGFVRPEADGWGKRLVPRHDEPGRFEPLVLEAGRYRVVVPWVWDAAVPRAAIDVPVTVQPEGTTRLDLRLPAP